MRNPFTPTFGAPPPLLVGRQDLLDMFDDALAEGPGSPGFATVYTGGRGVGKTVMLNAAEDIARGSGFAVISETASPGFLDRIVNEHLPSHLPKTKRKIKAASVASIGGVEMEEARPPTQSLRSLVEQVTLQRGLLITLDELQGGALEELRALAVVLQHAIRESRPLAFCAAGLSTELNALLGDRGLTFFRRADHHVLTTVERHEVADAFQEVIQSNGRSIDGDTARVAAESTGGYPFLIQLVGYHSWRQNADRKTISLEDVRAGSDAAARRIGRLVFEPALEHVSAVDRTFLLQMAVDNGPSRMADIASRLGSDANYASQYRLRLIGAGLIESAGHGRVQFALPQLREFLRAQGGHDTLNI